MKNIIKKIKAKYEEFKIRISLFKKMFELIYEREKSRKRLLKEQGLICNDKNQMIDKKTGKVVEDYSKEMEESIKKIREEYKDKEITVDDIKKFLKR